MNEELLELMEERRELAFDRLAEMPEECLQAALEAEEEQISAVFKCLAEMCAFANEIKELQDHIREGGLEKDSLEELRRRNHALYAPILGEAYETSFLNPAVAVEKMGGYGQILCAIYKELRAMIPACFERDDEEVLLRAEFLLQICGSFLSGTEEGEEVPNPDIIKTNFYEYVADCGEPVTAKRIRSQVCTEPSYYVNLVMNADLSDNRYLYYYGAYITEEDEKLADFLRKMPEDDIASMASVYAEGYRIGFEVTGKDLSKKKTVDVMYRIGFEPMVRKAIELFAEMGLKPTIRLEACSVLHGGRGAGAYGAYVNRQYDYDHKHDIGLILDKALMARRLEHLTAAFEEVKEDAAGHAGPAVIEVFGEADFEPKNKPEAVHLTEKQQQIAAKFRGAAGQITTKYIIGEERSFTIIAFPIPDIGEKFEEVFAETVRLNTLDYKLYQRIQQTIIDALDQAHHVTVKGMGKNRTDITVMLRPIADPAHQTNFENCVADVNIPVGEVFTSPVLAGTNGVLHVTKVFLDGMQYTDLEITFKDGMIADYRCANFPTEEENRKLLKENVLFNYDSLPIGEFAIGTNTTAFTMARRLGIESKLPILIAEKTGPHFAVGDTCYSHEEDTPTYNPDGKEIIAKDNEVSACRKEDPDKAYFSCHTDITIPYDELGELTAVKADGSEIPIIREGRFVLPGCEELNIPLEG